MELMASYALRVAIVTSPAVAACNECSLQSPLPDTVMHGAAPEMQLLAASCADDLFDVLLVTHLQQLPCCTTTIHLLQGPPLTILILPAACKPLTRNVLPWRAAWQWGQVPRGRPAVLICQLAQVDRLWAG